MLTANYKDKTLYVDNTKPEILRTFSENRLLHCPDCNEIVIFKECNNKQSHFSHYNSDCSFPFREPESIEHESGKKAIFQWLSNQFKKENVSLEKKIDETNQRADTFVDSTNTAVEFQCSPILEKTLKYRYNLYNSVEIHNIWILGYSMHKYFSKGNSFTHKLNQLEEVILNIYGKIVYYDILTHQFIFISPEKINNKVVLGKEYFFKPEEVFIQDNRIVSKYDYFLSIQKKRSEFLTKEIYKAKETDDYIKNLRKEIDAEKILATKKQVNYIKFLLHQQGKKIPYKLHGLLKDEATEMIKNLKENA